MRVIREEEVVREKIIETGNCTYCGNHIEDGHLFLCEKCMKLQLVKELKKNGMEIKIMKPNKESKG